MVDYMFLVNMEGMARRIKAKAMVKTLKVEQKSARIPKDDGNLIKFAEEVIENGVEYKNESKIVSMSR